jgi:hypothetical protein
MRVVVVAVMFVVVGCGIAPVRRDGSTRPPPIWRYAALHARPLAFGGGVCEVNKPHNHEYPPSPRDAFQETPAGLFDTRPVWPYFDRHPHHGRTCFREGWHLHLEKPDASLVWDEQHDAWRAP